MLDSVKVAKRQSEIRQSLAELAGQETLTDETRSKIDTMDGEYQDNERRYRAALIAEDEQRRAAKGELETRSSREWHDMLGAFEMRQVDMHFDEGRQLSGQTAEIVQELREAGGFRGIPVRGSVIGPWNNVCERAGIERLTPHCCRHGFATSMFHLGFDPKTVAERGGWKDAATVLRTYAHAMKDRTVTDALFGTNLTPSIIGDGVSAGIKRENKT